MQSRFFCKCRLEHSTNDYVHEQKTQYRYV